jgi:hypothetical protein
MVANRIRLANDCQYDRGEYLPIKPGSTGKAVSGYDIRILTMRNLKPMKKVT